MTSLGTTQPDQPDQLDARLRAVWFREQTLHLAAGLLAFCRWVVPLFLVLMLIDWLTYMPSAGRVVMLALLLGLPGYRAWACGWRRVRPFDAVRTALKLETQQGGLDSLLVSALQLRRDARHGGGSAALADRTCRLAEQAAAALRPKQAVPYQPLRRPGLVVLCFVGVIGAFAVANTAFLAAGAQRLFTPWSNAEYPTNTQITLRMPDLVVKEGDRVEIAASIGGVIPKQATIAVKTGEGRAREIELDIQDGRCVYTIDSASRDFAYRFKAGDDRTDWRRVSVIPPPRVERVRVELDYPDYLGRGNESVEALTLTVPEGTGIKWHLTLDQPVSAAQFIRGGADAIDLQVSEDGRGVTFAEQANASQGYNFSWVEKRHAFRFTSPRYYLQVASDQPPRVELTAPAGNLVAMIGRPLDLAVRVQDDHGIGEASVLYRVNQRDEAAVDLPQPPESGQGDQVIDWDYRAALGEMQIGDTVAFAVRVRDKYPGASGPHAVRSETRRVTFLSEADYLAQIEKQKDRLLSRVQTIYRQQRSAHQTIGDLSPQVDGYTQACQLEAIRQEMVRDQLKEIAGQLQALLDDLSANGVSEAAEADALEQVRTALLGIAESPIARAANLLRGQSADGRTTLASADSEAAGRAVNTAARALGRLVLRRGIDSAQEVFARETRMLAQAQAAIRWRTASSPSAKDAQAQALAKHQDELAQWTEALIADLQNGMRYGERPLAVLRLTRAVKDLNQAGAASGMREAGGLITSGNNQQALAKQAELVRLLLNAEFSVRLSGAYATLVATRDQIRQLTRAQAGLHQQNTTLAEDAFANQRPTLVREQTALRRQLLTLLLPTVPAPRARLFDKTLPQPPPVEQLLARADRAMTDALSRLAEGEQDAAAAAQRLAEQTLAELAEVVARWSVQMGLQTQGLSTLVAATSDRLSRIEAFEARVIGLLEKTDLAAAEGGKLDDLAEPQFILSQELSALHRDLVRQHQSGQDRDLPPLIARLNEAARSANAAVQSLKDNAADAAIDQQANSADALAEAYAIATAQNERLSLLQDLLMFQRAVGFANGYMADIVAEQRDLLAATESVEPAEVPELLPVFNNLRQCMKDVAPLLDLVAARMDIGTPLVFAQVDFEDAVFSLQAGDKLDAIDAQDVAAESLADVQARVAAVKAQTGYVAEIVQFLHSATSDAALLKHRQSELIAQAEAADADRLKDLVQAQSALLEDALAFGRALESATGMAEFTRAAEQMRAGVDAMKTDDPSAALEPMQNAQATLADNAEALAVVISMLHGLPAIELTSQTEPALVRLVDVLAVASDQRRLSRQTHQTHAAEPGATPNLSEKQNALAERLDALAQSGDPHALLTAASGHLAQAVAGFEAGDRVVLLRSQQSADALLRHFIVEQALILETAVPPPAAQDGLPTADGPGSDSESEITAGFISDFVSGETPDDKRTEWKVLADRNRAALNQNFARELPLEYRGLLKDYYERVAK